MYYFLPSLTFGLYIYVGVSDCLVLACAKVLGTLQPCQLLWPPKAFLLPKRLQTWPSLLRGSKFPLRAIIFSGEFLEGSHWPQHQILNIHNVYSPKFPALVTPGFAPKSPQSVTVLFPLSTCKLFVVSYFKQCVSVEDYHLRVTGSGVSMLTQPSVPTQQNISLLASSCFAIILRLLSYLSAFVPPRNALLLFIHFLSVEVGGS